MKSTVLAVLFGVSALAHANPFDAFTGRFKVKGAPHIKISDPVQCRRFQLSEASTVELKIARSGRTHAVRINKADGSAVTFNISEYNYERGIGDSTKHEASTSGRAPNFALNSAQTYNDESHDFQQISFGRPNKEIELRIQQSHEENGDFGYRKWSCEFIAKLK
jgi:hypothetical protein